MLATLPTFTDADFRALTDDPDKREAGFGALSTARGRLPLAALEVEARLDGLIAGIDVRQTFVNTHAEALEATYIFPLPDRAAVTAFRLEVAGRVVEGTLQERTRARQEYDRAIKTGHRAAIAEEERPGVFTMRVGNLPPGERAVVRLSLVGPMPCSDGEVTFRFPLVVAPRYIPGAPLAGPAVGSGSSPDTDAVPDASRISPPVMLPGFPNPVALSLSVLVPVSVLDPRDFRSSLHTVIEDQQAGQRRFHVVPGERLDRDFILRFRLDREQVHTALSVKPDVGGDEGTFLLTVLPPRGSRTTRPRNVVFVLDRSGSMDGWKMVAARRAVSRMVETLTEHDRFTIYAFDDHIETPPGFDGTALVPGSDHQRFRASEFLSTIDAAGGTEMEEPLSKAVEELQRGCDPETSIPSGGIDRVLVLITDGQVGNEDQILKSLGERAKGIRIFTLGIDRAVNAAFLRRLADLGGGCSEVVESEERLDAVMDQVHRLIGTPVLTNLEVISAGLEVVASTLVPGPLPDLFAGSPLLISGRYRGTGEGSIRLAARSVEGEKWSTEVHAWKDPTALLDKVWARGRVRALEDRYLVDRGDKAKLENEILATSLRFGVLCRFTAFVAVDRAAVVNVGGEVKQVSQAVEEPAGWGQTTMLCSAAPPPNAAGVTAKGALGGVRGQMFEASVLAASAPAAASIEPTYGEVESLESCLHEMGPTDLAMEVSPGATRSRRKGSSGKAPVPLAGRGVCKSAPPSQSEEGEASADQNVLQRLLALFGLGKRAKAPSLDRSSFRDRVEMVVQKLQSQVKDSDARLEQLRSLTMELESLFRDLVIAGDRCEAVERLGRQLVELSGLLRQASPDASTIQQHHAAIVTALRDWLAQLPAARGGASQREGFWR